MRLLEKMVTLKKIRKVREVFENLVEKVTTLDEFREMVK